MFKAVVSREHGNPWPPTEMCTRDWLKIPPRLVAIADLIAMQEGVYFRGLAPGGAGVPVGGDELPHVVHWKGELYLEDGHHRVVRHALDGLATIRARVLFAD